MTNEQIVPAVAQTTPATQQQTPTAAALEPVREYTAQDLAEATQKNELGDYLRFGKPLERQLQEKLKRPDLMMADFISFGLRAISNIGVTPIHIKRTWNNRQENEKKLGLVDTWRNGTPTAVISADNKPTQPKQPTGMTQEILTNFYNYAKTCREQQQEWTTIRETLLKSGWQKSFIDFCCIAYGDGETKPVLAPVTPTPPPAPVVKTGTLGIPLPNLPVPL